MLGHEKPQKPPKTYLGGFCGTFFFKSSGFSFKPMALARRQILVIVAFVARP
jgi:uncharacterized membrane protein YdcZ (DUF606 family)